MIPAKRFPDVMLRAELDALPIYEESGKVYHSENEGKSHACGHDGHMAVILGVARYLKNNTAPGRESALTISTF
jgi:metal-dependent amidase/aminoacylase/carboxypeptidase family protein